MVENIQQCRARPVIVLGGDRHKRIGRPKNICQSIKIFRGLVCGVRKVRAAEQLQIFRNGVDHGDGVAPNIK